MPESEALYIDYGTTRIPFILEYSKRKTLGISVTPDKRVTITAPIDAALETIFKKLGTKAAWISKQLRRFAAYEQILAKRSPEYVSGETFYYLGRKYRLKVIPAKEEEIKIYGRYLQVYTLQKDNQARIAELLLDWYRQRAREKFAERFARLDYILRREQVSVNQLLIRKLEKRWGSCTDKGNIILNLSLVQAPVQCIDYVLVHEICHLKYLNHGTKFYRLLSKYQPYWEKNKSRLQEVNLL